MNPRILFVDDEKSIVDGLRRLLRPLRNEWEMVFVTSGAAALEEAAQNPFDVVVSDMRMPEMDGVAVLTHFQENYPGTLRFVLSGHAEMEAVVRSVSVAHQFLAKPCDKSILMEAVSAALKLRSLFESDLVVEFVGKIDSLPSRPDAYTAILRIIADPDAGVLDATAVIESDVAMSAKVLHLVNSSFFGLTQHISDLDQATAFLGLETLRDLVLSIEVFRAPASVSPELERQLDSLQHRSLLTATACSSLFEDKAMASMAYTAGMLHDIGLLVLATAAPDHLEAALARARDTGEPLHLVEHELYGVTHAEIGAYLLGAWGLPYPIVLAAAYHHCPQEVESAAFGPVGAVHVVNALISAQLGEDSAGCVEQVDTEYLESIGRLDELDTWRQLVAEMMATPEAAA